jgi:hypothetical protein
MPVEKTRTNQYDLKVSQSFCVDVVGCSELFLLSTEPLRDVGYGKF